jgi:hypothetical protein
LRKREAEQRSVVVSSFFLSFDGRERLLVTLLHFRRTFQISRLTLFGILEGGDGLLISAGLVQRPPQSSERECLLRAQIRGPAIRRGRLIILAEGVRKLRKAVPLVGSFLVLRPVRQAERSLSTLFCLM